MILPLHTATGNAAKQRRQAPRFRVGMVALAHALSRLLTHAGQLGANAVIGVRYDANEIAPGITEVLCYGTAVFVEPQAA